MPIIRESTSEAWIAVLELRLKLIKKAIRAGDVTTAAREARELTASSEIVEDELWREFGVARSRKVVYENHPDSVL
jgi:hypothetical protein